MWGYVDPCGPLAPTPPNSRLSSLLWQSVQKTLGPTGRAETSPFSFNINGSRLGWGNTLLRSCVTGWLEIAVGLNCGTKFNGSPANANRVGKYPNFRRTCLPILVPWHRRQFS